MNTIASVLLPPSLDRPTFLAPSDVRAALAPAGRWSMVGAYAAGAASVLMGVAGGAALQVLSRGPATA